MVVYGDGTVWAPEVHVGHKVGEIEEAGKLVLDAATEDSWLETILETDEALEDSLEAGCSLDGVADDCVGPEKDETMDDLSETDETKLDTGATEDSLDVDATLDSLVPVGYELDSNDELSGISDLDITEVGKFDPEDPGIVELE